MRFYKKNFSKTAKRDFAIKMAEIEDFVKANGITQSYNGDSYYFILNMQGFGKKRHEELKSILNAMKVKEKENEKNYTKTKKRNYQTF